MVNEAQPLTEEEPAPVYAELEVLRQPKESSIFTRRSDPFATERVDAILKAVRIGTDLTDAQRSTVVKLIRSYADCFALSVSEVLAVPGAVFKLNIPDGATFSKKVHQKSFTPPQRTYLNRKIDEMLEAGVIASCDPSDVRCVSPITLAKKAHDQK